MDNSKDQVIIKNGIGALAKLHNKLDAFIDIPEVLDKTLKYLLRVIETDGDIDNLKNSWLILENHCCQPNFDIGFFLSKIIFLLRFLNFFKNLFIITKAKKTS